MEPHFDFHLATSFIVFAGSVTFSWYTNVGWWSLGGLFFFVASKIGKSDVAHEIFSYICLGFGVIFYAIAFTRMGWTF